MIMKRSAVAAAVALAVTLSLPAAAPARGHLATPAAAVPQALPIGITGLFAPRGRPPGVEDRTGYRRTSFRHWNAGEVPADGCNTRAEVLLAEAWRIRRSGLAAP